MRHGEGAVSDWARQHVAAPAAGCGGRTQTRQVCRVGCQPLAASVPRADPNLVSCRAHHHNPTSQ